MQDNNDNISKNILELIKRSKEPLETKEIQQVLKTQTRTKILYRLNLLRGDGKIKGKQIGSGKGTWIWWSINLYERK